MKHERVDDDEKRITRQEPGPHSNDQKSITLQDFIQNNNLVSRAYDECRRFHQGQKRKSGEDFFEHPVAVAEMMIRHGITDPDMIAAGLLHDTAEDFENGDRFEETLDEIEDNFGARVRFLVDGVSKFRSEKGEEGDEKETLVKISDMAVIDPRVAIIKLFDRLHNMRTIHHLGEISQKAKSWETLNNYAPFAGQLEMWDIKVELEDRAFAIIDPEKYCQYKSLINSDPRKSTADKLKDEVSQIIVEGNNIDFDRDKDIAIRPNGVYAVYKKHQQRMEQGVSEQGDLSDIHDIFSIRLALGSHGDCGVAVELLRKKYGDRIDSAKVNLYRHSPRLNGYAADHLGIDNIEVAIARRDQEKFNREGVLGILATNSEADLTPYLLKLVFEEGEKGLSVRFLPERATILDAVYALDPDHAPSVDAVVINGREERDLGTTIPHSAVIENIIYLPEPKMAPAGSALDNALSETQAIMREQTQRQWEREIIDSGLQQAETILSPFGFLRLEHIPEPSAIYKIMIAMRAASPTDVYKAIANSEEARSRLQQAVGKLYESSPPEFCTVILGGADEPGLAEVLTGLIADMGGSIVSQDSISPDGQYNWRLTIQGLDASYIQLLVECINEDTRFELNKFAPNKIEHAES